jgi:hypothetical protein
MLKIPTYGGALTRVFSNLLDTRDGSQRSIPHFVCVNLTPQPYG